MRSSTIGKKKMGYIFVPLLISPADQTLSGVDSSAPSTSSWLESFSPFRFLGGREEENKPSVPPKTPLITDERTNQVELKDLPKESGGVFGWIIDSKGNLAILAHQIKLACYTMPLSEDEIAGLSNPKMKIDTLKKIKERKEKYILEHPNLGITTLLTQSLIYTLEETDVVGESLSEGEEPSTRSDRLVNLLLETVNKQKNKKKLKKIEKDLILYLKPKLIRGVALGTVGVVTLSTIVFKIIKRILKLFRFSNWLSWGVAWIERKRLDAQVYKGLVHRLKSFGITPQNTPTLFDYIKQFKHALQYNCPLPILVLRGSPEEMIAVGSEILATSPEKKIVLQAHQSNQWVTSLLPIDGYHIQPLQVELPVGTEDLALGTFWYHMRDLSKKKHWVIVSQPARFEEKTPPFVHVVLLKLPDKQLIKQLMLYHLRRVSKKYPQRFPLPHAEKEPFWEDVAQKLVGISRIGVIDLVGKTATCVLMKHKKTATKNDVETQLNAEISRWKQT